MKANVMLADAANVADGKLNMLGGGWTRINVGAPFAVIVHIEVPWSLGTETHHLKVELLDEDAHSFEAPTNDGSQPLVIEHPFTTGIPAGAAQGTPLTHITHGMFVGLPLEPNSRYEWRATINGETRDEWTATFSTVAAPAQRAA